jgi:hypothetical protein
LAGLGFLTEIESPLTLPDKTPVLQVARMPAMQDRVLEIATDSVSRVDLLARAAFTWVRQQSMEQRFLGSPISMAEETELAAGFLAGLRSSLDIGDNESVLVAYSYALMRGERSGAVNSARDLISRSPGLAASCSGFLHGINAARKVLAEGPIPTQTTWQFSIKASSSTN